MKLKFLIPFAFFVTMAFSLAAQPGPGMGRGFRPRGPVEPPLIPIDAGASILLAAGALFGAKKIYDMRKKNQ